MQSIALVSMMTYVMEAWAKSLEVKKVEMLPDGNGVLASALGMLVKKENLGLVIVLGVMLLMLMMVKLKSC